MAIETDWDVVQRRGVSWGEMDAYGHVNNAVYLRWFEDVRITWLERVRFPEKDGGFGPVLKTAALEFIRPARHPDIVVVRVRATAIGRSSVSLEYDVIRVNDDEEELIAKGTTVVVLVDHELGRSMELPPDARARIGVVMERRNAAPAT